MFFHTLNFDKIGGFDENFFLYFEETDFCLRARKLGLISYQLNEIKLLHYVGTSVDFANESEKEKIKELYIWHFIWSKFYFHKKHKGFILSIIYFIPVLIRTIIKKIYYKISKNEKKSKKYNLRYEGLLSSIKGNKSDKRI